MVSQFHPAPTREFPCLGWSSSSTSWVNARIIRQDAHVEEILQDIMCQGVSNILDPSISSQDHTPLSSTVVGMVGH